MTVRWTFMDPEVGDTVILPINPQEMTSPYGPRAINWAWGTRNGHDRMRGIDLGSATPHAWDFGGVIREESHYLLLESWARRDSVLRVTDHLRRTFEIIIEKFDPVETTPTPASPWRADYTMTCLLLKEITS